jgi:hypothetical protein
MESHLAQLNVAQLLHPIEHPQIEEFVEAGDRLEHYRAHGPSSHAFWFGELFPAPAVSPAPV